MTVESAAWSEEQQLATGLSPTTPSHARFTMMAIFVIGALTITVIVLATKLGGQQRKLSLQQDTATPVKRLATEVVTALLGRNLLIAAVESCTGGGLANSLTNVPGASGVIRGAWVTYSDEAKVMLGVPATTIAKFSVYSLETAEAMASAGLAAAAWANVSVGITGSLTRIDPNNRNSQPGVVYIAVAGPARGQMVAKRFTFAPTTERSEAKAGVEAAAFSMILKQLSQ
jgi:nicotinamide-nucleotide amidase